ncbi:hypothetical protein [Novosphingobium sp. Fuku2-ISO-50]|jgi:hypothetical protein|nr:hypothetical protein [Novosphingobium sp. Fuku2-ISO-50]
MPNIRTANKNHKRIIAADIARRKLAEKTLAEAAKPAKVAL